MENVYMKYQDLPDWVKKILKENRMRPVSTPVTIGVEVNVGGHNLTTLYLYDGEEVTELKGAISANPWATHMENAIAVGSRVTIPRPECMILEIYRPMGMKMCSLYAHPDSVIPALMEHDTLTTVQKAVLLSARMYKSSYANIKDYRYYEMATRYPIGPDAWQEAKQSLIEAKYLNKRGAIMTAGLNMVRGLDHRDLQALFERGGGEDG